MTARSFVALDIETTGLDPQRDRVTEVAAVRFLEDGTLLETFESLVNPGRAIPAFVEALTGINERLVRDAPAIGQVGPALAAFVGESSIVGQNIGFDLACLKREGLDFATSPRLDTAELSRILLPARQPRSLGDLAASLGIEPSDRHRALADARTAALVFSALLRRLGHLPAAQRVQLARLVSLHDLGLAEVIAGSAWADVPPGESLLPSLRPPPVYPQLQRRQPPVAVPSSDLAAAFEAAGNVIEDFEVRMEQREMAEAVRDAFATGAHLLVEAGTGVGKSFAYLLPAALHALRNGERVVVSTNTINLQEQLLRKDVPALRRVLKAWGELQDEADLRVAVLKGRSNYLCLRRWTASYAASMGDPDFARLAAAMLLWLPETETGDRSEFSLQPGDFATWQRLSAQDADCLARQPAQVREGQCFLLRARKSAESAHIVIVNHALLLADTASGGSALPAFDHLVLDEAHNLEDQATQHFGAAVTRRFLFEALDGLYRRGGRDAREGGVAALLLSFPEGAALAAGNALHAAVLEAGAVALPLFEAVAALLPSRGEDDRLQLTAGIRAQPVWEAVELAWDRLDGRIAAALSAAETAAALIEETALIEEPDALAGEVRSAARRLDDVRSRLTTIVAAPGPDDVTWAARDTEGLGSLHSAPLDVGPILFEHLLSKKRTVVATSATLAAGGDMSYTARRLGFEAPATLQLGSPFDYQQSTLLAAFTDVPEPADPGYLPALSTAIARLVLASEGRALALFTSHAQLRQAASLVRPMLDEAGINLLVQGVDGQPRQLTDNLLEVPRSVIFGTSSFWEGVDIRGDALSLLIIARLPFAVPTDPVHRARSEQYDNPFAGYSLPSAILRFRQGFGRLIRDRRDRGVVAVLDRRIYEKSYGRDFVAALPRCTMLRADSATVASRTRDWLAK